MKIGIGIPGTIETLTGSFIKEYARRADAAGFSTITHLDRLVYSNNDPFMVLTTAAAVTTRIRLMTSVLLAPMRGAAILAKQAATLDAISGGRLTLGMAVGSRKDDYAAAPASYGDRGKRFDEQLALMRRAWSGESAKDDSGPVGPNPVQPGGPELLIGGRVAPALRRVAQWGTGYVTGAVFSPATARGIYEEVVGYWREAGRTGDPRFVGTVACAIGDEQALRTAESIDHYYHYRGPAERNVPAPKPAASRDSRNNIPSTVAAIREVLAACEQIGMDEVIVRPGVPELDQVDKLAELLG
jgi:alkanesulfonate monooxygenase SsuD/methylene tetrahydromethanopterin reductase-like flavin-dependent oxidoreductase (luciferase family)